jgi:hypothetical protein
VSVVAKDSAPSLTSHASPERTGEAATLLGEAGILRLLLLSISMARKPIFAIKTDNKPSYKLLIYMEYFCFLDLLSFASDNKSSPFIFRRINAP